MSVQDFLGVVCVCGGGSGVCVCERGVAVLWCV